MAMTSGNSSSCVPAGRSALTWPRSIRCSIASKNAGGSAAAGSRSRGNGGAAITGSRPPAKKSWPPNGRAGANSSKPSVGSPEFVNMPEFKQEIGKRLEGLGLSPVREAEIIEELTQHLDDQYEQAISR